MAVLPARELLGIVPLWPARKGRNPPQPRAGSLLRTTTIERDQTDVDIVHCCHQLTPLDALDGSVVRSVFDCVSTMKRNAIKQENYRWHVPGYRQAAAR